MDLEFRVLDSGFSKQVLVLIRVNLETFNPKYSCAARFCGEQHAATQRWCQ